ncbi:MerR family transcriptional regulator [Nocardia suismassiliense]|uniref:MerR family transcriptional regulator n=1 Tax=Nocardia suismassiliense TaxID=2077092 RepID=UPI001F4003EF|nr:MerR family transcriptional regulator [Nocardia suismassiliense]
MTTRQAAAVHVHSQQKPSKTPNMREGFTIDQAAAFAGVTVMTVQDYHQRRLVDEPACDISGLRRYRSAELLRLVQVRTLAGAGVPLAEIGDLLDYLSGIERVLESR